MLRTSLLLRTDGYDDGRCTIVARLTSTHPKRLLGHQVLDCDWVHHRGIFHTGRQFQQCLDVDRLDWRLLIYSGSIGTDCRLCTRLGWTVGWWVSIDNSFRILNDEFSPKNQTDNYNENESRAWYCALLSATGLQYIAAVAGIVLLYIYYDCTLNKFIISINLVLCIMVSVVSILPQVQEKFPRSGLLQSSVVTLYAIFLTWSALSNNPDTKCHTDFLPPNAKNAVRNDSHISQHLFNSNNTIELIRF